MKPLNRPLKKSFSFAGFNFPRYLSTLPRGTMATRLARYKRPICGNYYSAPNPLFHPRDMKQGGYHQNGDLFGLRWKYCDDVAHPIRHTGWFIDDFQDWKIRGVVFTLPHGRGFVIGWTMGEGMAACIDYSNIYHDENGAAFSADSMAQKVAEKEQEYREHQEGE